MALGNLFRQVDRFYSFTFCQIDQLFCCNFALERVDFIDAGEKLEWLSGKVLLDRFFASFAVIAHCLAIIWLKSFSQELELHHSSA